MEGGVVELHRDHLLLGPPLVVVEQTLNRCVLYCTVLHCTVGHEGPIGDLSCMSIFSACFGLLTSVQLAATTWSGIWISC